MKYNKGFHLRHSIRLPGFDYARAGAYFVTVCVQGRGCLLGEVLNGEMLLNPAGEMVEDVWNGLPERFPEIVPDEFIVMPNHVHAIVWNVGAPLVGALGRNDAEPIQIRAGTRPAAPTLGDIVGAFKSMSTNAYIRGVNTNAWPAFPGRLWQRNYYERVSATKTNCTGLVSIYRRIR